MTDNVTALAAKIDWSSLAGVILDGGYELKEVLDGRDRAAKLRVRILGSGGKTGLAYFLHLEPADVSDQLDIWQTLRDAPHPNVNRPATLGRLAVAGFETVYLVLTDADEKLAAVVPERPLEWEEAAEVLHSCEKGLAHLHAHGLVHGSVSPQTVEAVGYSVLLNTESVRRVGKRPRVEWNKPQYLAPESRAANLTTAADVWCLGATLFEVLSQEPYGSPGVELEKGLPLGAVIHRCLDRNPATRCGLKEAPSFEAAALAPPAAPPPPPQPEPTVTPQAAPEIRPPSPAAKTAPTPARPADTRVPSPGATPSRNAANRIPHPLTPKPAPKQVSREDMALVPVGKRHKRVLKRQPVGARIRTLDGPEHVFMMGEATTESSAPGVSARILAVGNRPNLVRNIVAGVGLALLLVAAIWFIIIPKLRSTEVPLNSPAPAQTATATDSGPSLPSNLQTPSSLSPTPTDSAASQTPKPSASDEETPAVRIPVKRELFRVVVSTFVSRSDAAHELDALSQLHPDLLLRVIPSKNDEGDPNYLLVVGGLLNRSEAQQLHERLLAEGLKTARVQPYQKPSLAR